MESVLRVYKIFRSVMGEVGGALQGEWAVFLRLAGCNLRCSYCDTKPTQDKNAGEGRGVSEVQREIMCQLKRHDNLLITGGEPLLQQEALGMLVTNLLSENPTLQISIETNGTLSLPTWDSERITWVVDCKMPNSGMHEQMVLYLIRDFLMNCKTLPFLKFVCSSRLDYSEAKRVKSSMWPAKYVPAISACTPLTHNELFQWMKEDKIYDILFNVQIHKLAQLKE